MYTPNLNDPRVKKRISLAYTYAIAHFGYNEASPVSIEALNKRFGQSQTPIAKWLKKQLLICTDMHYSEAASLSMKYVLNKPGVEYIQGIFGITKSKQVAIEEVYVEEYKDEFKTGDFTYKESSNRYFHPIQNLKKENKYELFYKQGYNHDYDIQCCAPTLLYQEALNRGLEPQPIIHEYIEHRTEMRQKLANELNTTTEVVKKIITAFFQGARLGTNEYSSIYREHNDVALINKIRENEYITSLRESIVKMWKVLPISDRRSGKLKNDLYRQLEQKVLKSVIVFLKNNNNKHFTEHDGWKCEYEIDEYQLFKHVRDSTGYCISVSHISLRDVCEIKENNNIIIVL